MFGVILAQNNNHKNRYFKAREEILPSSGPRGGSICLSVGPNLLSAQGVSGWTTVGEASSLCHAFNPNSEVENSFSRFLISRY